MPRPVKPKIVHGKPIPRNQAIFKPLGIPIRELRLVVLSFEEYEAIRLIDWLGKSQVEAARQMNVSQPTISRLINSARNKVADALVNGKALKIEGGTFKLAFKGYGCRECGASWEIEEDNPYAPEHCPKCNSGKIFRLKKEV